MNNIYNLVLLSPWLHTLTSRENVIISLADIYRVHVYGMANGNAARLSKPIDRHVPRTRHCISTVAHPDPHAAQLFLSHADRRSLLSSTAALCNLFPHDIYPMGWSWRSLKRAPPSERPCRLAWRTHAPRSGPGGVAFATSVESKLLLVRARAKRKTRRDWRERVGGESVEVKLASS